MRYTTPPVWLLGTLAGDMWMTRFGSRRDCVMVMGLGRLKPPHWLPFAGWQRRASRWNLDEEEETNKQHKNILLPAEIWVLPFQILSQTPDRLISSVVDSPGHPLPPGQAFQRQEKGKGGEGRGKSRWRLSLFVVHCRMRGGG